MVKISELIAPSFIDVWNDMLDFKHREYWLKGGRGSTKSSVLSLRLILGLIVDSQANALVLRKYKTNIRDSVFEQCLWAIGKLGVSSFFVATVSPMQITYTPTGQKILFRGLDDPGKSKSIKVARGYIKFLWFEELDQFAGMKDIHPVIESVMRGGEQFQILYSYNPPESASAWVNSEQLVSSPSKLVHHSTYLDVPVEWLGKDFILEAENIKRLKPAMYKHTYLGEVTGTGTEIFGNLEERKLDSSMVQTLANEGTVRNGMDFGFASDPAVIMTCIYDKRHDTVYLVGEWWKKGAFADDIYLNGIKKRGLDKSDISADCEDPRTIAEVNRYGARLKKCKKGRDSVALGIVWLRRRYKIVIDSSRCPNAWREFSQYEYTRGLNGEIRAEYPDKNNHTIDSVRYALEDFINDGRGSRFI